MITNYGEILGVDFDPYLPDEPYPDYWNGKAINMHKQPAQRLVRAEGATENDGWIPVPE